MFLVWMLFYLMLGVTTACLQKIFMEWEPYQHDFSEKMTLSTLLWPVVIVIVMPFQILNWFYSKIF